MKKARVIDLPAGTAAHTDETRLAPQAVPVAQSRRVRPALSIHRSQPASSGTDTCRIARPLLQLRDLDAITACRPTKLTPADASSTNPSNTDQSLATWGGMPGQVLVELSDDDDEMGELPTAAHGKPTDAAAGQAMEEGVRDANLFTHRKVKHLSLLKVAELVLLRQTSIADYAQKTNRHASKGTFADNTRTYDPFQQSIATSAASGTFSRIGGRPVHMTSCQLSNALSQRFKFLESVALPPALPPVPCSHIAFDTQGVLFAVGHIDGSIDLFDLDECVRVAQIW